MVERLFAAAALTVRSAADLRDSARLPAARNAAGDADFVTALARRTAAADRGVAAADGAPVELKIPKKRWIGAVSQNWSAGRTM